MADSDDHRIRDYLVNEDGWQPDTPTRSRRRSRGSPRRPRTNDGRVYPVTVTNRYDGTHQNLRDRALQEAVSRGVDPAEVRATGPGSFEFYLD